MANQKSQKNPVVLFVVWCASSLAFTAFNKYGHIVSAESTALAQDKIAVVITILVTAVYFLPMLVVINHQAKAVSLKWLTIVTRVLLLFFSCALIVFFIGLVFI